MQQIKMLIVDDEVNITRTIAASFDQSLYQVESCYDGDAAWQKLTAQDWDIVFLDLKLPGKSGMDILADLQARNISCEVIVITAHGTIEHAVQAMKYGAVDFIQKPMEPAQLRELVRKIIQRKHLAEENAIEYADLMELAKLNIKNRSFSQAKQFIQTALDRQPASPEAYNYLGGIHEILGDVPAAIKAYQTALKYHPDYLPALENLQRLRKLDDTSVIVLNEPKPRK